MPRLLFFWGLLLHSIILCSQTTSNAREFARAQQEREMQRQNSQGKDPSVLRDTKNYNDPKLLGAHLDNRALGSLFNPSNYPVLNFSLHLIKADTIIPLPVSTIKIIDARFDKEKVSYLPVSTEIQKKGYSAMGIQIAPSLSVWLKDAFADNFFATDSNSKRELVIVIKKCWFSNSANQLYTYSKPALLTNLHYEFDIYTSLNVGYYPQKIVKGIFTTRYNNGDAYTSLTDSLLTALKKEISGRNFSVRETETNWLSPVDFNDYYTARLRTIQTSGTEKIYPGVYETFTDFLERKVSSDSIQVVARYNNNEMIPAYASQINAFKNGVHMPVNQSWGYFDGISLFINAGNGFFIRLYPAKEGFLFINLKSLQQDAIKRSVLSGIQIGGSEYQILKDYPKAYALTFQLDMDTGKLY